MASKTLPFAAALLVIACASSAQAQILGLRQLLINGTVHCCAGTGSANTAVFPNAGVQLKCGSNGVSTATTNSDGAFSMSLSFITSLLSTLLNNCKLVVITPLSTCDASLPTDGRLQSALQLLNGRGLIGRRLGLITNFSSLWLLSCSSEDVLVLSPTLVPSGFSLVQ